MGRHGTRAMYHATAMVRDYDAAVERLGELIGLRVLEYSELSDPLIGRRGGMTWVGDGSLELCEPIVDGAAPDRFVRRTGGGMQGVALLVEEFSATIDHLDKLGTPMPVQMPEGFGFSSPRTTAGIQLEWAEFSVEEDPRFGAQPPEYGPQPVLDVAHLAYVGAVVDDPVPDGRRLAALFDTEVTFERPAAGPGEPVAGVSVGDCTLALFPRVGDEESLALWGRAFDRPRVSLMAVMVAGLDQACAALSAVGVRVLDKRPGVLVLDPKTTADVELAVVDDLLLGDPRR